MNNKNYTIKIRFPTFIVADIYKKILTLYSRVESEVGSEEIFVLFRPDDARVAVAVIAAIVVVLVIDVFVVISFFYMKPPRWLAFFDCNSKRH